MEQDRFFEREIQSLYERHGKALVAYACSFGLDFVSAQDVVQQVFFKLLSSETTAPEISPGYLYRAVRNTCLNASRSAGRGTPLDAAASWLIHRGGNREAEVTLQKALAELPEEQREVVMMRIWSGMTLQEIAVATSTPLNTVASRYRYALARLRIAFGIEKAEEGKP